MAVSLGVRRMVHQVRQVVVETVYPRTCAGCGERGTWLCEECARDAVPLVPELCCDRCGHPDLAGRCQCSDLHPAVIRARGAGTYAGWMAKSVVALKYQGERERSNDMARWMVEPLRQLGAIDGIIPVPLHDLRERSRGYNQSRCLAEALSLRTGVPVVDGLVRVRATQTQTTRDRDERLQNMDQAFALRGGWTPTPGAHYVVMDDVMTTGATIYGCVEALEAAGVSQVSVLAFVFDLLPRELERYRSLIAARG